MLKYLIIFIVSCAPNYSRTCVDSAEAKYEKAGEPCEQDGKLYVECPEVQVAEMQLEEDLQECIEE
jgi:hypothetical protein